MGFQHYRSELFSCRLDLVSLSEWSMVDICFAPATVCSFAIWVLLYQSCKRWKVCELASTAFDIEKNHRKVERDKRTHHTARTSIRIIYTRESKANISQEVGKRSLQNRHFGAFQTSGTF